MISRILALFLITLLPLRAAEDPKIAKLRAADDERVSAIVGADPVLLNKLFSDDLRYAHSTGAVDTKKTFIEAIVSGRSKYEVIRYTERNFSFPAPNIALVSGRANVKVVIADGLVETALSFLAVWREEQGQWRFLAWQSCKVPPPVANASAPIPSSPIASQ
jgi:hypothetical protein